MRYTVVYSNLHNLKAFKKLPLSERRKIMEAIEQKLTIDPAVFGKPLRYSLYGHRCLRVGDYRIIYHIEKTVVYILSIGHRSTIYRDAKSRRRSCG